MLIGYMRVSKADGSQTVDLQRDALTAAGVDPAYLYEDRASGRGDDRPGLAATLKALRPGDTLVVWKLDRLGRDLRHLVNTVHDLTQGGVGFKVLTGHGASIDTTTPDGKLVFGIFARVGGVGYYCPSPEMVKSAQWRFWPPLYNLTPAHRVGIAGGQSVNVDF